VSDVRVGPGPGVPEGLVIPSGELVERYSHASGPGGQGVNTSDSRVQLSFDVAASAVLSEAQRARLLHRLAPRLDGTVVTIVAAEFRSPRRPRHAARPAPPGARSTAAWPASGVAARPNGSGLALRTPEGEPP
jgi:ribosome-associated protein